MAATVTRGAQFVNSTYFKPMLRKAYHRKSASPPEMINETVKLNGEEVKNNNNVTKIRDDPWWVPDNRTGIFYPMGQEKIIEQVPPAACTDIGHINWFSNHEDSL